MSQSYDRASRPWSSFVELDPLERREPRAHVAAEPGSDLAGQERRLALFRAVEEGVSSQIERLCATTVLEVSDVGVLVLSPAGHLLVFGQTSDAPAVVLGDRQKLYAMLASVLPHAQGEMDPFEDLLHPAPSRCVRVLVLDGTALTVLSYGTFVTLNAGDLPDA